MFIYRLHFETVVLYFTNNRASIPISFLLGFFVSGVIARWYRMYLYIPWINRLVFLIEASLNGGNHVKQRKIRQIIYRYINVSWILCLRKISHQIKKRFCQPNLNLNELRSVRDILTSFNKDKKVQGTLIKLLTDSEIRAFEKIAVHCYSGSEKHSMPGFWIPLQWSTRILQKAFIHGYLADPKVLMNLINEIETLRGKMHEFHIFCNITIPLVYTQVIIIAVYSYFFCEMMASQSLDPSQKIPGHEADLGFPFFSVIQFVFFTGWLKVALCVLNPFGDDDEDFHISDMLDYNLDLTYRCTSEEMTIYPDILDAPNFDFRSQPNHENDTFDDFLKSVDDDIEETSTSREVISVTALELPFPGWGARTIWNLCAGKGGKEKTREAHDIELSVGKQSCLSRRSLNDRCLLGDKSPLTSKY